MNYDTAIHKYYRDLQELKQQGGQTEGNLRRPFENLLAESGHLHNIVLLAETPEPAQGSSQHRVRYDGKLKHRGGIAAHGYWEAKDTKDRLAEEVSKKKAAGYDFFNILFENTEHFILYQNDREVSQGSLQNEGELAQCLKQFYSYRNQYEEDFRQALAAFKASIPAAAAELHSAIDKQSKGGSFAENIAKLQAEFAKCNTAIRRQDVHEFIVQHILTIELFRRIFGRTDFEKFNPIARLVDGEIMEALGRKNQEIGDKTQALLKVVANVLQQGGSTSDDKQKILIAIYEEFFTAYNPKKADTHGIVYTPREIVQFMVASADGLLHKHFGCRLQDPGVRILDPCTGTGTFITAVIEHIPQQYCQAKARDIYGVEVDMMAYYMAQFNIEEALCRKLGAIAEPFTKLALADTLEIPTVHKDVQNELLITYAGITPQNAELVQELQASDFLVILGNPPYNASQQNEGEHNRNKAYFSIDKRIGESYGAASTATNRNSLWDMYIRFFRWASDKLLYKHTETQDPKPENSDRKNRQGAMLCFVSNRSYIDKLFTDGMRKAWAKEWDTIYILDLGGDLRSTPKNSEGKLKGNVFGIQTGVAICFLLKGLAQSEAARSAKIYYHALEDYQTGQEKLEALGRLEDIKEMDERGLLQRIRPDAQGNWLRKGERDFAGFMSMGDKETKAAKLGSKVSSIFQLYSNGPKSNRDEWVYSHSKKELAAKMQFLIKHYEEKRKEFAVLRDSAMLREKGKYNELSQWMGTEIKWSRDLRERDFLRSNSIAFDESKLIPCLYRPFVTEWLYYDSESCIIEERYRTPEVFGATGTLPNICIIVPGPGQMKPFYTHAVGSIPSLDYVEKATLFPRYRYAVHSRADILAGRLPAKIDNITYEALAHFTAELAKLGAKEEPSRDRIFAYCYGLLQQSDYLARYADNLRRELPRLPVRPDFTRLADRGQALLDLHLNWEQCPNEHYQLQSQVPKKRPRTIQYRPKSDKEAGTIRISNALTITDIPQKAWDYRLGGRSAIDWVLEFYKESKNRYKDESLTRLVANGKLEPYSLAGYEEQLVNILERVINVSLATQALLE